MAAKYHIGCSGWHYGHWRGLYYPKELPKVKWLSCYAQEFNTVELNNTFYRLPSEKAFSTWRESTPDDFVFAVKVSRFITHINRLRNLDASVDNFLSRAAFLKEKLGPLLYQLPPSMRRDDEVLENFLSTLPSKYQHVIEFRHESWIDEKVFDILRRHSVGLCGFDAPGFSCPLVATTDFAYVRLHGSEDLYSSRYSGDDLAHWARRIARLGRNLRITYVYFNNDVEAFAIENAKTLRDLLRSPSPDPECRMPELQNTSLPHLAFTLGHSSLFSQLFLDLPGEGQRYSFCLTDLLW